MFCQLVQVLLLGLFSLQATRAERATDHLALEVDTGEDVGVDGSEFRDVRFICCLNKVQPKEDGNPDATEMNTKETSAVRKCILTAESSECNKDNAACASEEVCTKLFKQSHKWYKLRLEQLNSEMDKVREAADEKKERAEEAFTHVVEKLTDKHEDFETAAESKYKVALDNVQKNLHAAEEAKTKTAEELDKLTKAHADAETKLAMRVAELTAQGEARSKANEVATQTYDLAQKQLAEAKEAEIKEAEDLKTDADNAADKDIKEAKEKLEAIHQKIDELSKTKREQEVREQRAHCEKGEGMLTRMGHKVGATTHSASKTLSSWTPTWVSKTAKSIRNTKEKLVEQATEHVNEAREGVGLEAKVHFEITDKENFEVPAVDCCCSFHLGDGNVAMRVKGEQFINWDECHAPKKYSETSTWGAVCNWFGECTKCRDAICDDNGKGVCP